MAAIKYNIRQFGKARVIFTDRDENVVGETYDAAVSAVRSVLRYFGLKLEFPLINLFIVPSRKEYDRFVAHLTRVPTDKWRLGQPQGHDFYLISPNSYPADVSANYLDSEGACDRGMYKSFIKHEIVHMVEELISPMGAMELRPQWWGDGLAVYITGQYRDRITSKCMKRDLAAGKIPGIDGLKGGPAYIWGWSLVRYIEKRFGRKKILEILQTTCEQDIPGLLKLGKKALERDWQKSLKAKF